MRTFAEQAGFPGNVFASTHWSVVLLAGKGESPGSAEALELLARIYWYPLYAFTRRKGYCPHDAADLTQDFFSHLLSTKALMTVDPNKGRFRSFLLASLKNLLANDWHRTQSQKRGGGAVVLSLDEEMAEGRYAADMLHNLSPDKVFDRQWAEILIARALERLRAECDHEDKRHRFDELKIFLLGEKSVDGLAGAASKLQMSLSAVKALVYRLRRRFGELIRDDIAQTVTTREQVEEEIQQLFAAFNE